MKYGDLIQFDPIESVVQLRQADVANAARRLVETFVISERMADQLTSLVIPQLQFDKPADNKGLLIVGNYGTGKSHLMALISAIAEHADLASVAKHPRVADKATMIAGRFQVVRAEIGAVTMPLRDIVCGKIENQLAKLGVSYTFPDAGQISNNKDSFQEMMGEFQKKFPDQGILFVLDELLDYLRSRNDHAVILDLNFLREMGEVCKITRFRFAAGVQESLFESSRFQFVAETLRRVKDRFEQVSIVREDVAYVVSQRLLKKNATQQAKIREHLLRFAPLYGSLNERMDEFVRLFPVHPAYLSTFERVVVAEKREILKTLSTAMRDMLDMEVPDDAPGLLAFDGYWSNLKDNPSFRSIPDIRDVVEKSKVLEDRIQQAFTRPAYKPVALRIIHALSVHRLTTDGIRAALGITAEELRDDLCLSPKMPEQTADFLKTTIETVLKAILQTVSGQFITYNKENGQYYLDIGKDIDFDSLIEKKAETIGPEELDRYYFDALSKVMECADQTYVTSYRIWEHEVEWREKKAGRSGYLFFGAPNERSTAQPPRDFYLYFLQPQEPPHFKDERNDDEVFFRLKHPDEVFLASLKLYAGARELASTASGENKKVYEQKAVEHLRKLTGWLQDQMLTAFEVTYQGRARSLTEVVQGKVAGGARSAAVRDVVNTAASLSLAPHFQGQSPEYPTFSVLITVQNRGQAAQEALRWIAGGVKGKQGAAVLDALEVLEHDQLRPRDSRYAKHIVEELKRKGEGQILNRSELVEDQQGIEYWTRFRLEPEFLAVVLAALVYSGDVELAITGKKIDASNLDEFARRSLAELVGFKHVRHPTGFPLAELKELFELLGLPPGLVVNEATREEAVRQLQARVSEILERLVRAQNSLSQGLVFWGRPVLAEQEKADWNKKLASLKQFLQGIQPLNTPAKLKNFRHEIATIRAQKTGLETLDGVEELVKLIAELAPLTGYLTTAEAVLPEKHPWRTAVHEVRGPVLAKLSSPQDRTDPSFLRSLTQSLAALKVQFQDAYLSLHQSARLNSAEDRKKAALNKDQRLQQLRKLSHVEMMPVQQLHTWENTLHGLNTCIALGRNDLEATPICPHCGYRPTEEPAAAQAAGSVLRALDDRLEEMIAEWTRTLLDNLADPTVAGNIDLVTDPAGRQAIRDFMTRKTLPEPITDTFVKALQEVLSGLQKVVLKGAELLVALVQGGLPCTVDQLRSRFAGFTSTLVKNKSEGKVRIVVE